jgi:dipeptide/tripeptide permease
MLPLSNFSDDDAKKVVVRAVRLLAIVAALAVPLVWWKVGWQSATLLAVGAAISGAGLWKWLRLMSVVIARMDTEEGDGKARPVGSVLVGFFITLILMLVALYVSLKFLDGSVYALAAGLAMGVFSLTFEALRLVKAWTV